MEKESDQSRKKKLTIIEGTNQKLFGNIILLYREMLLRKGFKPGIKVEEYPIIQERLPKKQKMKLLVCLSEDKPIAGLVGASFGDVGIELIAATSKQSLHVGASFLLRWKMVELLKDCGCHFYNLNGINPKQNPGGYQFKSGLAGKLGYDLYFLGEFHANGSLISNYSVKGGEYLKFCYEILLKYFKNF